MAEIRAVLQEEGAEDRRERKLNMVAVVLLVMSSPVKSYRSNFNKSLKKSYHPH